MLGNVSALAFIKNSDGENIFNNGFQGDVEFMILILSNGILNLDPVPRFKKHLLPH